MKHLLSTLLVFAALSAQASEQVRPNFVIILTDDQGYNDLGCYGSEKIKTPRIDQMASEGIRLTSFYQAAPLCGPSRAALLTGCYSQRVAEPENTKEMHTKLSGSEILIPELLKPLGYTTACFGKWHIAGSGKSCVRIDSSKNGLAKYGLVDPELVSGIDLFPTIARLAGAKVPNDRRIDGLDLSEFLFGKTDKSPRKEFYVYKWLHLHAIRSGDWKLVLPREAHPADLKWYRRYQEEVTETTLYDLKQDIGETTNVAAQNSQWSFG